MTQSTLFDHQEINIPLANKINSFYSADVKQKRMTQKERILLDIHQHGKSTQREISERTGIARHLIPDRILTLIKENKIKICGKVIDNLTNKEVTVYECCN